MRTCGPSPLSRWTTVVLFVSFSLYAAQGSEHPSQHLDSMGSYHLKNRLQCQNLCRYRQLCQRYSFLQLLEPESEEENCVLHTGSGSGAALPSGWTEDTPPSLVSAQGCMNQPCEEAEVCVPSHSAPFYSCLRNSAECPANINIANGHGIASGAQQGDVAVVHCDSHFAFFPRGAAYETVTCQVTSQWTEPSRECKQIIFENPTVPFTTELPETGIEDEWSMCILGSFQGVNRFTVNFFEGIDGYTSTFQLDFRYQFHMAPTVGLIWDTKSNGQWTDDAQTLMSAPPLAPGSSINLTFQSTAGLIRMELNDLAPITIDVAGRGNLSVYDHLNLKNDWLVDSVSLYRTC